MPQTSSEWAFWGFTTLVLGFFISLAAGLMAESITTSHFRRRQKKQNPQKLSQSAQHTPRIEMSLLATAKDKSLKTVLDEIHQFRVDTELEITGGVVLGVMAKLSPTYLRLVRASQRYYRVWLLTILCVGLMLIGLPVSEVTNMVVVVPDKPLYWLYMLVVTLLFGISIVLLIIYVRRLVLLQTMKSHIEVKRPMPIRWVKP